MKVFLTIIVLATCFFIFQPELEIQAASVKDQIMNQLGEGAQSAGYGKESPDIRSTIASTIKILLGLVGMLFIFLAVLSGYWLMSSHGEEEKVKKAMKTLQGAVVGLLVVLMAYSITYFISRQTQNITGVSEDTPNQVDVMERR